MSNAGRVFVLGRHLEAKLVVEIAGAGGSATSEQRVEIREKIPAAVEAASVDEDEGVTGQRETGRVGGREKSDDVDAVLRTRVIVAREDLEREQVSYLATGARRSGKTWSTSAAATTSRSMPEEANRRSTTTPPPVSHCGARRIVASRPVASCSTADSTR